MTLLWALFVLAAFVACNANKETKKKVDDAGRLVGGLPLCQHHNLDLRNASSGYWLLQEDGTVRYEFKHCRLKRPNHKWIKKCLRGQHLVFIGDSLSRYFYLSLVYVLSQRHWGPRFAQKPNHPDFPRSILSEKDFVDDSKKGWSTFYKESNAILNEGKENFEMCDCFREDKLPWYQDGGNHQQASCYENRYYRYVPNGNMDDNTNDVRISYIQFYGYMPQRGHKDLVHLPRSSDVHSHLKEASIRRCGKEDALVPLQPSCMKDVREKSDWDFPPFFEGSHCDGYVIGNPKNQSGMSNDAKRDCQRYENEVLGPLNATHLMMNIGWHSNLPREDNLAERWLDKVVTAADTLFYTTPASATSSRDIDIGDTGHHNSQYHNIDPTQTQGEIKTARLKQMQQQGSGSESVGGGNVGLHLPKVTWRSTTCCGPFHEESDPKAEHYSDKHGQERLQYFDVWGMTKALKTLSEVLYTGDDEAIRKLISESGNFVIDPAFKKDINNGTVLNTYVDAAHLEPYLYREIHNVFFSAVCPA